MWLPSITYRERERVLFFVYYSSSRESTAEEYVTHSLTHSTAV